MKTTFTVSTLKLWIITILSIISSDIFSQQSSTKVTIASKNQYCNYVDKPLASNTIYGFASDNEAKQALERIMQFTGLPTNFQIMAANVPNACAVIKCNNTTSSCDRYIMYNQEFMMKVKDATQNNWSSISILAHEIGHHLSGHTLDNLGSRPEIELEADKFSGFVLAKMGASLDDSKSAMELIGSATGSSSHPAKDARIAAIVNGWTSGNESMKKNGSANTNTRTTSSRKVEINMQTEADLTASQLSSCCAVTGSKYPKGNIIYDDYTKTDGQTASIHTIVEWTGASTGNTYKIEGILTVDISQGEGYKTRNWQKLRDIQGPFVWGCSRGCIR